MQTILLIYFMGAMFSLGVYIGYPHKHMKDIFFILIWPILFIMVLIDFINEKYKSFPPIWLELIAVLIFNKKTKASEEVLNEYFNMIIKKKNSLLNRLRIKAIKKIAKQNNIDLNNDNLQN